MKPIILKNTNQDSIDEICKQTIEKSKRELQFSETFQDASLKSADLSLRIDKDATGFVCTLFDNDAKRNLIYFKSTDCGNESMEFLINAAYRYATGVIGTNVYTKA